MAFFIHSASAVSAYHASENSEWKNIYNALEPDYAKVLSAGQIRRMGRLVKMGVWAAKTSLEMAGNPQVDCIITGTGFGAFEDSEKFLRAIISQGEEMLSPTPFIQSTHNAIAAQIALLLDCKGINSTHSNGGTTFECAIQEADLLLTEYPEATILLGTADEITQDLLELYLKAGLLSTTPNAYNPSIGEGAAFFLVNNQSKNALAKILQAQSLYKPDIAMLKNSILNMLNNADIKVNEVTQIYIGGNGSSAVNTCANDLFPGIVPFAFKKLCGEYHTASAFAMWHAVEQKRVNASHAPVVILNQFRENQIGIILLQ